jgi:hypothetical protein
MTFFYHMSKSRQKRIVCEKGNIVEPPDCRGQVKMTYSQGELHNTLTLPIKVQRLAQQPSHPVRLTHLDILVL